MASAPDVDNPVYGYFVTRSVEEVIAYNIALLRTRQRSHVVVLHSSALFEKENETLELHLPLMHPAVLDPQMPDIIVSEFLENNCALSTEAELYENIAGSGWSLVPGTVRYWFKCYPCQPNNAATENEQSLGRSDDPSDFDQDGDDPDRPRSPRIQHNFFLYALLESLARKENRTVPRQIFLKREFLQVFNAGNVYIPDGDFDLPINLSEVPEYHDGLANWNIRIFSMRGNILYAKRLAPLDNEWVDIYINSSGIFSCIIDLWKLFKKKSDRKFCMKCYTWKSMKHTCEQKKISNKDEEVMIPDIPYDRHGLVAYADFESIIPETGWHQTSGWGCVVINKFHQVYDQKKMNKKENPQLIEEFLKYVCEISNRFADDDGHETDECQICETEIDVGANVIIGRNFINGRQGNHHLKCWDHPKNSMYVFFHNFRGYDSHFLIRKIVESYPVSFMSATTMEKFNLISIINPENENVRITFKDTYNFFTCSLAKCVSMIEHWVYTPDDQQDAKGIFPYDWFDSFAKLDATELPPGPWYNKLSRELTDSRPAEELWRQKNFQTFAEYHDYYMMMDVFQLADAFEEFRRTCVDEFKTDPVHFQGAPGLTWYLGLCQNPELFKVITDVDVYMDIQNGIRGGIAQAICKYMNVEDKPDESMFFLDVNSLYSKCMTYKMPGRYLGKRTQLPPKWEEEYNPDTSRTAIMVVDLIYPPHLHDRDWAYPLAPHKYNDRLCTTFKERKEYMIHAELLSFYLSRGMILEKFHYLYEFEQDYTLRDYVQGNIEKRRHTQSEVMKTLYKLLNNSLYGKTCENVNKYRKFDVIEDESLLEDADNLANPTNADLANCKNVLACGPNLLVEREVEVVRLNKPIQIGFTVLEFAKREIYTFLAAIQDHFGDSVIPLYTDTDSLLFWCDFAKPWEKFYQSPVYQFLDFEKTPEEWNVKTPGTDKQSGLWSVEAGGKEIVEYCGLRAKCYCYRFKDNSVVIKNKGVPKSAMIGDNEESPREKITMEHYKKALFDGKEYRVCQYMIRSFKHDVMSYEQYKLGLSSTDFKRAVTKKRSVTLPFGYQGETFADIVADDEDTDNLDP
uniref:DNA-directed DNA polymerase n=1 Tax=Luscinia cyane parvoviridae sp. TaxID=2794513 RepID=A0A8E7L620_9VIRU|nr:MAG: structural protein [Luscinia cyane parvoviridae sp.]